MDEEALEAFAAYCRLHRITFVLRQRGQSFHIDFDGEEEDIAELIKYLEEKHDTTHE